MYRATVVPLLRPWRGTSKYYRNRVRAALYTTQVSYRLYLGILLLGAAAVDFYYAYRSSKRSVTALPAPPLNASELQPSKLKKRMYEQVTRNRTTSGTAKRTSMPDKLSSRCLRLK